MKAYKGFTKDMKCRDMQYEEGKTYETDKAELCNCGFHACEMPLNCFDYYKPTKSEYHEVELDGDIQKSDDDTKCAATKITIGAKLDIKGIVKAQIEFVLDRIRKSKDKSESDADYETAATSGNESSAATSGNWSSAATSGYRSSAATSGYGSSAATSGNESSAATSNKNNIAVASGKKARAKGVIGSHIVLTEWNDDSTELIAAKMVKITGKKYKPDTWYILKNGSVVEWTEADWE